MSMTERLISDPPPVTCTIDFELARGVEVVDAKCDSCGTAILGFKGILTGLLCGNCVMQLFGNYDLGPRQE